MWLIEFVSGHLKGVALPVDSRIVLTGEKVTEALNILPVPEYLSSDIQLEVCINGEAPYISRAKNNGREKKLVSNKIYKIEGIEFFVYQDGKRAPKLARYNAKKYRLLVLMTVFANLSLLSIFFYVFSIKQQSLVSSSLQTIGTGYIKNGRLKVFDAQTISSLPKYWALNTDLVYKKSYKQVSQFNINLVSEYSGRYLNGTVVNKLGRDQIRVETFEKENKVMSLFGQIGITYKKQGNYWYVSNLEQASYILKNNGLGSEVKYLRTGNNKPVLIDSRDFPYSIFYSGKAVSYIYDQEKKYWKGSQVPGLGVLVSIENDKVTLKDGVKKLIYFY